AGGNRIDSIVYETSDLRKYRDQARDMAVRAAREKATALALALGQEGGKAHSIEEGPESNYGYGGLLGDAAYEAESDKALRSRSTAPGQKTISASVVVSFDLN